jgi:hypothetical protein
MKKLALLAAVLLLSACDSSDPALREKMIGKWAAKADAKKTLDIRPSGELTYVYDPAATPPTTFDVFWELKSGKVTLSIKPHGEGPACAVKVSGDDLTIENGSGRPCMGGDPINMEMEFTRLK